MKNHQLVIVRQVDIQLDAKTVVNRMLEGRQAVFRQHIIPKSAVSVIIACQVCNGTPGQVRPCEKPISRCKTQQHK